MLIPGFIILMLGCMPSGSLQASEEPFIDDSPDAITLSLEEAIDLALEHNRSIRGAEYNLEGRKLALRSTKSEFKIKMVPYTRAGVSGNMNNLGAGINLAKKFSFGAQAMVSPGVIYNDDNVSGDIGVSLNVPLLRNLGRTATLSSIHASEHSLRAAERSFYQQQVNLILETVAATYAIVQQKELVRLNENQVESLQRSVESAKIKEQVGLASPIDIYRAEIRLRDAEDSLVLSREALRNGEDRLKLILSFPVEAALNIEAPVEPEVIEIREEEAIEIALENRVEMKQMTEDIVEARRRSRVAKQNLRPQLDLVFDYQRYTANTDLGTVTQSSQDRWSINLVGNSDVARTSEKMAFRQSQISVQLAELDREERKEEIKRQVRQQLETLIKAEDRIRIRQEQIHQAEGKLALANIKFSHDMADNFDVIEAQTELQRARVGLLSVKTEYITDTYRIRAVLGTLLEH